MPSPLNSPLSQPPESVEISTVTEPDAQIVHSNKLWAFDLALTDFERDISPWNDPSQWIQINANHINSITQRIVELANRREIEDAGFVGQDMIYPVLLLFVSSYQGHPLTQLGTASCPLHFYPPHDVYEGQDVRFFIFPSCFRWLTIVC